MTKSLSYDVYKMYDSICVNKKGSMSLSLSPPPPTHTYVFFFFWKVIQDTESGVHLWRKSQVGIDEKLEKSSAFHCILLCTV